MRDVLTKAEELTAYAKENLELDPRNELYVKNRLLEILAGVEGEAFSEEEADEIYGVLSLSPAEINAKFQRLVKEDTKKATDWFFDY